MTDDNADEVVHKHTVKLMDENGDHMVELEVDPELGQNLFIEVYGELWGSIWFHTDQDGRFVAHLGGYADGTDWNDVNPIGNHTRMKG